MDHDTSFEIIIAFHNIVILVYIIVIIIKILNDLDAAEI